MLCAIALLVVGSPANLVPNPAFRHGVLDPEKWSLNRTSANRAQWVADKENPSIAGLRLVGSGTDWAGATSRPVPVSPGTTLTVAAWLRSAGANSATDNVYVRFFGRAGFVGQEGPPVPSNARSWTMAVSMVRVPDGALTADVSVQVRSRGTVLLGSVGLFHGDVARDAPRLLPRPALGLAAPIVGPRGLPRDANRNGLPDLLERTLAIPRGARSVRLTRRNTTCLQTPTGYTTDNDLKVDTVLVVNDSREAIRGWQALGYRTPFMAGFRAGPEYLTAHPGSAQTDQSGRPLDCGPGSFYMVPTEDRRATMRDLFRRAAANGAEGAAPEEPEYFGTGAYAPALKREYEMAYGRPWVDPASTPQARVDAQRLMGRLEIELLRACYEGSAEANPKSEKWMLVHSPVNYFAWAVAFPFHLALQELRPDHMISQVWTGTAQSPVCHEGMRKARTFENAYLEYSSSLNLVRGSKVKTWLLMDPLEDAPGRPMAEYFDNYKRTLAASLLFPETDRYEVMPWPTRIFGQVPDDFATVVTTIVNVLADMQNQKSVVHDRGTEGIGTFLADSVMWQRNPPFEADFDHFYGLSLPLFMKGIPVQVAYLDRAAETGYLDPYKVLLVSFDAMKPQRKEHVDALAAWVRAGGTMIVCGGDDAYNVLDMWWTKENCSSPHAYLLKALGMDPSGMHVVERSAPTAPYAIAVETPYTGRNLENRSVVTVDLTRAMAVSGAAYVRLTDTIPGDGWGPWVAGIEVRGVRNGTQFSERIDAGSPEEAAITASDSGSGLAGGARFIDGTRELVYRLAADPGTRAEVRFDIGNQYRIEVAPAPAQERTVMSRAPASALGAALDPSACEAVGRYVTYANLGARAAIETTKGSLVAEAEVGKGSAIICGIPAAWFTRTIAADAMLRAMVRYACGKAGLAYREQGHVGIDRGAYKVVKAFDGPAPVSEATIDLMTPDLAVRPPGPAKPDEVLVLKRLPKQVGPAPVVAACSDCIEWQARTGRELRLVASNASGIKGALRVVTGGRAITAEAWDAFGKPKQVRVIPQGGTALVRYDSEPRGLGIRIRAK